MKNYLFLSLLFALFLTILLVACKEEDTILRSDSKEQNSESDNHQSLEDPIPASAIKELHQMIAEGKFDEAKETTNSRRGDGRSSGIFQDFGSFGILEGVKTGELCPRQKLRGDNEFGGGPLITSSVRLYASGNLLFAYVTFRAEETKGDRSTVVLQSIDQWVHIRTFTKQIRSISTPSYSTISYRGGSAGPEFGICHDGNVESRIPGDNTVTYYRIIGDTGYTDISDDDNCQCDTKIVNIELKTIALIF